MKVIVAGSRSIKKLEPVSVAMSHAPFNVDEIIHGGAKGVDSNAEAWAQLHGIPTDPRPVDDDDKRYSYSKQRKGAPLKRNEVMAQEGDALIAIWSGESTGTENMMEKAEEEGMCLIKKHESQPDYDVYYWETRT